MTADAPSETPLPTSGACYWPDRSSASFGTRPWQAANPSTSET